MAAILGDSVNYAIGARLGPRVFHEQSRFLNRRHLERTHAFYERYGAKTIVIARFVPIVRTFAPFVAGIGQMRYARFLFYNVAGGVGWIVILVAGGYLFGNIPVVRRNFSLVIFAIIVLSILPALVEVARQRAAAEPPRADRGGDRLLHRAGGEAGDVVVEEEDVEDHDRHRAEHRARHQRAPEVDVAADQLAASRPRWR